VRSVSIARRCLVVGASDGIGRALVRALVADGWDVVGVSRSPAEPLGERYTHVVLDVRDPGYRKELSGLGVFDACVYCAGVGELLDVERLGEQRMAFEVNLLGAVDTAEVMIADWLPRGRGHLVVLSSLADAAHSPEAPGYAASKAGASRYFESLALALRPRGIAITNVRFGFVDTKMAKSPVKPFMMSAERAAAVVAGTLASKPIRRSAPWPMVALMWAVGLALRWRVLLG